MGGGSGSKTDLNAANAQYGIAGGALNQMNPIISALTSGGYNLPGVNQQAFQYLLNPGGTTLAGAAPSMLSFYQNEMTRGLSPSVINAAYNQNQVANQQNINSILNQMGPNTNIGAIENQLSMNAMQSNAMLGSQLAAQNQGVMAQGAQGLGTTSTALDQQRMQMLMSALQAAIGEQTTGLGALQDIFGMGTQAGTSLTGQGAQLQNQEANAWANALSGLFGGVLGLGAMGSMGINPFSGLSTIFGGGGGVGGGSTGTPSAFNYGYGNPLTGGSYTPGSLTMTPYPALANYTLP